MHIGQQNRIASAWGFHLGGVYRMTNGGELIPLAIWEREFDGAQMVTYKARAKGERDWQEGDSTPNTILQQIGKAP